MTAKKAALQIISTLQKAGFEAVLAGGCVRDELMGFEPNDFDVATNCAPDEVETLFDKTIPVGKQFGVVRVLIDGVETEVATFRSDSKESDGRRPDSVEFSSMEEDAKRRDLTINGMFFDPISGELLDFVGGQEDIKNKVIRFIGDPNERIDEDRLRILRVVRFATRLGFTIDRNTLRAIKLNAHRIHDVSTERIKDEFDKILKQEKPSEAILLLKETGLLAETIPELLPMWDTLQSLKWHREGNVGIHTMMVLDEARKQTDDLRVLWAALLHDVGKPRTTDKDLHAIGHEDVGAKMADEILERLRFATKDRELIVEMIRGHMRIKQAHKMKAVKLRRLAATPSMDLHKMLSVADTLGAISDQSDEEKLVWKNALDSVSGELPEAFMNGDTLKALGFKPGPEFKTILTAVLDAQIDGKVTTPEEAENFVIKRFGSLRRK